VGTGISLHPYYYIVMSMTFVGYSFIMVLSKHNKIGDYMSCVTQ